MSRKRAYARLRAYQPPKPTLRSGRIDLPEWEEIEVRFRLGKDCPMWAEFVTVQVFVQPDQEGLPIERKAQDIYLSGAIWERRDSGTSLIARFPWSTIVMERHVGMTVTSICEIGFRDPD